MKRKFTQITLILLIITIFLTSCAFSPGGVILASKSKILSYAKKEYGEAEYISKTKEEHSITYLLKDKEYGFTYTIKSYANDISLDGATFGYNECKSSDFNNKYREYILKNIDMEINNNILEIDNSLDAKYIFFKFILIDSTNEKQAAEIITKFGDSVISIDKRGYLSNRRIILSDTRSKTLGAYLIDSKTYKTQAELDIDFYMEKAAYLMKIDNPQYLYSKTIKKDDVPGLENEEIVEVVGVDSENINCYYFKHDEKEYFIASINVRAQNSYYHHYIFSVTDNISLTNNLQKMKS